MNIDKYTIKAQEAIQTALRCASQRGQQAIEPEHLLYGIMEVGENVTQFLFSKLSINRQQLQSILESQLRSLPKVEGGQPYLSTTTQQVLRKPKMWPKSRVTTLQALRP